MDIAQELSALLSPQQISTSAEDLDTYGRDWTKHYTPKPSAIVFPKNTQDVVSLVKWARQNSVALVPSGGRTGLSAGAFALNDEVVVSLEKMNRISEMSHLDRTITCQAGVITEQLQQYAEAQGYLYPVDFAARGSSQIGGNVATNAGGIKVIRYGMTRDWISGLTVVTGTGEVLKLGNSLIKNATGYDLKHLIIGSEGTLGIITEVTVKVTRPSKDLQVFLFGVDSLESVMNVYQAYNEAFPLMAYEMFTDLALKYVKSSTGLSNPMETEAPYYILMEIELESDDTLESAMKVFEACMERGWIIDGAISQNGQQAKDFWRLREDITEATSHKSPYKNDVSVKVSLVPQFLNNLDQVIKANHPDFEVVWFGHIGDGNLHINILKPNDMKSEDFVTRCKEVDKEMFKMIENLGGSVSAEHGVGLTKKAFLSHSRSASEIQIMKSIKQIFDPDGILNPGKLL